MEIIDLKKFKGEFFKILAETDEAQIGVMTIKPGKDSGEGDLHPGAQIIYIIEGSAEVGVMGKTTHLTKGVAGIIPAKTEHRIYNRGGEDLFFLAIYAPRAY